MRTIVAGLLSMLLAASAVAQTGTSTSSCDGEQRCRAKLIKTLDSLAKCQEQRADQPAGLGGRGTQDAPIVFEYKTPTWVWVTLALSLIASTALGIYTIAEVTSAAEDTRRMLR